MSLKQDWKNAVAEYKAAGGKKTVPKTFGTACGAVDDAYATFDGAKPGKARTDAFNAFGRAVKGLRKAKKSVTDIRGNLISRDGTPEEDLVSAAESIIDAADGALKEAMTVVANDDTTGKKKKPKKPKKDFDDLDLS